MSSVISVTSSEWKESVLSSKLPVVVEFYTPTCPYCRQLTPLFKKLSSHYTGRLKFVMVDASLESDLASGYGVMGVPTLKFLCSGRPIGEIVGLRSEVELGAAFEEILKNYQTCITRSSPMYA